MDICKKRFNWVRNNTVPKSFSFTGTQGYRAKYDDFKKEKQIYTILLFITLMQLTQGTRWRMEIRHGRFGKKRAGAFKNGFTQLLLEHQKRLISS